jgi:4-hydroxy-3-methylbut-2-enyl diphosphate reductase
MMQVFLANPRGFCAGVDRAIDIVERALELFGRPIYVRHEVVHNRHVVERLRAMGAVFVDELAEVPEASTVIFSAHGVSSAVEAEARTRQLTVFNATCPLVTKVHMEVQRYAREGRDVLLIGHAGHPEVEGTMGRFDTSAGGQIHLVQDVKDVAQLQVRDPQRLAFVTQTTLSMDDTAEIAAALHARFPDLATPRHEDICYATQNRQDAVKKLLEQCDVLLIVGSRASSTPTACAARRARRGSRLLPTTARRTCAPSGSGKRAVGVSAGASTPEVLVQEVLQQLKDWGGQSPAEIAGREEHVFFALPRELRRKSEKSV